MVKARDIDRIGTNGVIEKLKERVRNTKVYISVDIDVLDPAFAPGKSNFDIFPTSSTSIDIWGYFSDNYC